MNRIAIVVLAVVASVSSARSASAQELPPERPHLDPEDLPVRQKSYFVPFAEIMVMDLSLGLAAQLSGVNWGQTSLDTIERNVTTGWELDTDAYSTNQLAHPFGGALLFSAARSTGHDFWVSGIYAFGGSMMWELILENEIPSLNDQLTTPIGGMFIGEAMHRFSRALISRRRGKPPVTRQIAAAMIDPIGALNRSWWGDAWAKTYPPTLYAHFGLGWQQPTDVGANRTGDGQVHLEAYVRHGLVGDREFEPRYPLDHFDFHAAADLGPDSIEGALHVRGMLLGTGGGTERVRGFGGLYGAYDFNNNDHTRASMLGFGPGGSGELRLGERGYLGGTLAAYLVPYGAAGGANEEEDAMRDHHDGPGLAQLVEIEGGIRGSFALRLTNRAYQIAGRLADDTANEYVFSSTAGTRFFLTRRHAIGVEGTYAWRRANYADDTMQTTADRTADVRAFYALTTDDLLGE